MVRRAFRLCMLRHDGIAAPAFGPSRSDCAAGEPVELYASELRQHVIARPPCVTASELRHYVIAKLLRSDASDGRSQMITKSPFSHGCLTLAFSGAVSGLTSHDVNRAARPPLQRLVRRRLG